MCCIFCQDNWTALLNAAREGFAEVVLLLLEAGANIEHRDTVSVLLLIITSNFDAIDWGLGGSAVKPLDCDREVVSSTTGRSDTK